MSVLIGVREPKADPSRVSFCSSGYCVLCCDGLSSGSGLGVALPGHRRLVLWLLPPVRVVLPGVFPAPQTCISERQTCPIFLPFSLPLEDSKFGASLIPQSGHYPYQCIPGKAFSIHQLLLTASHSHQIHLL